MTAKFIMISLLLSIPSALAAENTKRAIDVGDLEVNGEVRRPMLEYLDSDQAAQRQLHELTVLKFSEFEKKLLTFTTREEWKQNRSKP